MSSDASQSTRFFHHVLSGARKRRRKRKVTDSTGADLTGGMLLTRSFVLRRMLRRSVLADDEQYIGLQLPPSAAGVAANLALTLDRRITVNLNYTLTATILNQCIAETGIRHILTSRALLERIPLQLDAEFVCLEDFRDKPTRSDKLVGALLGFLAPVWLLVRLLGLNDVHPDDVMTVIFTSGSTGEPKGVMLTYNNIVSNVQEIDAVVHTHSYDVMIGVLPFFHSFGYTITLWAVLMLDIAAAYHVNPLDARSIGQLSRRARGTILLATPIFLRGYTARCELDDFASLEVAITGGEKLPAAVADAFEAKFGLRPIEGYGCTETSPFVCANVPANRASADQHAAAREGTVGRPAPGVEIRITDLETGAQLDTGNQGMLWVRGPNVMKGYLNDPDETNRVIQNGWYRTGDLAVVDADNFITIVGRESRFSKIAGEMVPHRTVEDAIAAIVGTDEQGGPKAVVISIPDPARGERLVVIHLPLTISISDLSAALARFGLPRLYLPDERDYVEIDALPSIGVGKLDFVALNDYGRAAIEARQRQKRS